MAITVRNLDGSSRRITRNARSQRHGRLLRDDLRARYRRPSAGKSTLTIAELLQSWLHNVPNRRASTIDGYSRSIRRHVNPALGEMRVQNLTSLAVADWASQLGVEGVGDRSREVAFSVLSMSFNYAMDLGLVEANPCARVKRPRPQSEEPDPFTEEEVGRILDHFSDDRLFAMLQLAMTTGMRQGELFGLEWDDIDWEAQTLHVKRQAVEHGGKIATAKPKTRAGQRTIKLTDRTMRALHDRRALALKEGFGPRKNVFLSPRGKTLRRSNFRNRVWDPLLKELGIRHRGMHHCRHTAATMMLRRGVSIHVVSKILGHARVSITYDFYAHFQQGDADAAAGAMADVGA